MDMAEGKTDDPGVGAGDGERVLPAAGRERETGRIHLHPAGSGQTEIGIRPAANGKARDTDVALGSPMRAQ